MNENAALAVEAGTGAGMGAGEEIAAARRALAVALEQAARSIRAHEEWRADAGDYGASLTCPEGKETYARVAELFSARLAGLRTRADRLQMDRDRLEQLAAQGQGGDALRALVATYAHGQAQPTAAEAPFAPHPHTAGLSADHLLADKVEKQLWRRKKPFWTFQLFARFIQVAGMGLIGLMLAHALVPTLNVFGVTAGSGIPGLGQQAPAVYGPAPEGTAAALARRLRDIVPGSNPAPRVSTNAPGAIKALPHVSLPLNGQHIVIE